MGPRSQLTQCRGDVGSLVDQPQQANGEVTQAGHELRTTLGTYLGAVLIKGHIPYIVAAVLNAPMSPIQTQQLLGSGHLRSQIGETIDQFLMTHVRVEVSDPPPDTEDLTPMRELQILVESGTGPNGPLFQPPMPLVQRLKVRGAVVQFQRGDVLA